MPAQKKPSKAPYDPIKIIAWLLVLIITLLYTLAIVNWLF